MNDTPIEENEQERETQAQVLLRHASDAALFHDAERRAYATVRIEDHKETLPIRSGSFKLWIGRAFYGQQGKPPSANPLSDALSVIEAKAIFEGPELPVSVRVAELAGNIYVDLCNSQWEAAKITPTGWTVLSSDEVPVKFRRAPGMLALPRPVPGGRLDALRPFINVGGDRQWCLLVGCLVMAFRPRGPYPVLGLHGEQGSAKSTLARVLRRLVDPHKVPLRSEPKEPRDLMIAANNAWCIALDNLSHLSPWLSDALCRLATGGGFGTRQLYTNDEEQLFDAMRPIVLNGIEAVATRPDLLERAVLFDLPTIPEESRRTEDELWPEIEAALPAILGAIFDAVACALRNVATVKLAALPRMADFAKWVTAAEPALGWKPGTFMGAYRASQADANEVALDASPIIDPLRQFMQNRGFWTGKSSELLDALGELAGERPTKSPDWPKRANSLSGQLKRLAPNLRKTGLAVTFLRESKARLIRIDKAGDSASPASPASQLPGNGGFHDDPGDDPQGFSDDQANAHDRQDRLGDDDDAHDDLSPVLSESARGREVFEL